jgi:hypothetical protein
VGEWHGGQQFDAPAVGGKRIGGQKLREETVEIG